MNGLQKLLEPVTRLEEQLLWIIESEYVKEVRNLANPGRHKVDNPRKKIVGIRLTGEEHQMLKERAAEHNLSITQAMTEAIKLLYQSWGY